MGSPQHLDPRSEGEPCQQETGVVPEASQHGGGKGQPSVSYRARMVTGKRVASGTVHSVCTDTAKVASLLRGGMWYLRMACQDRKKLDGRE